MKVMTMTQGKSRRIIASALLLLALVLSTYGNTAHADGPGHVEVIVQAQNAAAAAAWARGRGGEVTRQLGIVNAVVVRMPKSALKGLERAPGIRIYENRTVQIASLTETWTVRDEFNAVSYHNNDGTAAWAGNWSEVSDDGWPSFGDVTVTSNRLQVRGTGNGAWREADLSGSTAATLSFDFVSVDNGDDYFVVEVSADGGASFVQLEEFLPTGSGQSSSRSYPLQDYIPLTAEVVIRFRVSANFGGFGQYASVDNVQIGYTHGAEELASGATVRDEFNAVSYSNDDGTAHWATAWIEHDVAGIGPWAGNVRVFGGELVLDDEPNTGTDPSAARKVDLSGGIHRAVFAFDFRTTPGVDYDDRIAVEVSSDGGTSYAVLEEIGYINGAVSGSRAYDISAYISANTAVRFRVSNNYGGWDEFFAVDNVRIAFAYPETDYPTLVGADQLHAQGITGDGVTVAVLDSGYWSHPAIDLDTNGQARVLGYYDAIGDMAVTWPDGPPQVNWDDNGHGSHVASIVVSSLPASDGTYGGVAPDANLLPVRAFDWEGKGTYADIIQGVDYVVQNKDQYNIRVLNLSFSAEPQSYYWDDPLNQAVMRAWQAGIVVVAAAGNRGADPMTVGLPGNVPYVVTAGAFTDNHTPDVLTDDALCEFSSVGPTVEAFVKPELVAPGAHMRGLMPHDAHLATTYPDWYLGSGNYYKVSGTSQATAAMSGIVALMLQQNPGLSPDDVKCKLIASAKPAVDEYGNPAYSIFQQGAGLVDAYGAVYSAESGCANRGIDVSADLAGTEHYTGRANQDEYGNYYLMGLDGLAWGGGFAWGDSFAWGDGMAWGDAFAWGDDFAWGDNYVADGSGWVPRE